MTDIDKFGVYVDNVCKAIVDDYPSAHRIFHEYCCMYSQAIRIVLLKGEKTPLGTTMTHPTKVLKFSDARLRKE